jgi:hypothetical protein
MMRRREFITLLGNSLASSAIWPVTASAQKAISRSSLVAGGRPSAPKETKREADRD